MEYLLNLDYYYSDKKPDREILCYSIQNALLRSGDEGLRGGGCEMTIYRRMVIESFLNWWQEPREMIAGKANREIDFGRIFYRPLSQTTPSEGLGLKRPSATKTRRSCKPGTESPGLQALQGA